MARKNQVMMDLIYRKQFSALPGVEQFVRSLWRQRPLAICSGALREEIEAMLEGIALRDCFSIIVSAEDVAVGKPDPSGYLMTAKLISQKAGRALSAKDCLIVEDAPTVLKSVRVVEIDLGNGTTKRAVTRGTQRAASALRALGISELDPPAPPQPGQTIM